MSKPIALIAGATSGIGLATTRLLIESGWQVWGMGRDFSHCGEFTKEQFKSIVVDMADLDELPKILKTFSAEIKRLDLLLCSVGQGHFAKLEQFSAAQIRQSIDLNLSSQMILVREFVPLFNRQASGDIVIIGSEAALQGAQKGSLYCAAKFALRGFAQALRAEVARNNVRVSLINPGMVRTAFFDALDFHPAPGEEYAIEADDVAAIVWQICQTRSGTVLDEVNLSPQKKHIIFDS